MIYDRTWDDTVPDGDTTPARQIDDQIRNFKVDVHQRMNELVNDWTADPVTLKDSLKGGQTGIWYTLDFSSFMGTNFNGYHINGGGQHSFAASDTTTHMAAPVNIQEGGVVTVTSIELLASRNGSANLTFGIWRQPFSVSPTGATYLALSSAITTAGLVLTTLSGLSIVLDPSYRHSLFVVPDGVSGVGREFYVYGARIRYNRSGY